MLEGRVAVVTGAGRGIGRGVALALAGAGAKVVVNDDDAAAAVVDEIRRAGGEAVAHADTAATWQGGEKIVGAAVDAFGRIDILVTCGGDILRDRPIFEMAEDDWHSVLSLHLKGTFTCVRHAAPLMREQRYGRIITFSSASGLFGNPGQASDGAAKAGISGLTKVVAKDLGKYGVTCNSICPDAASAEDVAPMVVFLASEQAAQVNGQFFHFSGGSISLLSQPRAVKTIWKQGRWTLDELDEIVPRTLADAGADGAAPSKDGPVNPAPARAE